MQAPLFKLAEKDREKKSLVDLLACPECRCPRLDRTPLTRQSEDRSWTGEESGIFTCPDCRRWYPVKRGVPCLLPDRLRDVAGDGEFLAEFRESLGADRHDDFVRRLHSIESCEEMVKALIDHDRRIATGDYLRRAQNKNHDLKLEAVLDGLEGVDSGVWVELGCGGGTHASALLQRKREIAYVGVDRSYALLRDSAKRIGYDKPALFVQASLESMPFRDEVFRAAYSVSVFHMLEDPQVGFSEAWRMLERGGRFINVDFNRDCYKTLFRSVAPMYDKMKKRNVERWMEQAGFSNATTKHCLYLPGSLPIPLALYRFINAIGARIPYLKKYSIMLHTWGEKLLRG